MDTWVCRCWDFWGHFVVCSHQDICAWKVSLLWLKRSSSSKIVSLVICFKTNCGDGTVIFWANLQHGPSCQKASKESWPDINAVPSAALGGWLRRSNCQLEICAKSQILGRVKFCFENKSSGNGFEEPLCYFAALLKRRGAVMNEQCEVVSMKKKPQFMTGRRAFRGNRVTRKWTENLREMYWHRKCLPYVFFAALPFLSFVVFFSLKPWTTFYLWERIMVAWSWKELRALCSCKLFLWGLPGVKLCTRN